MLKASRSMLVDSTVIWPTDQTFPFLETSGGWTAATRRITANDNPPSTTPFNLYAFESGDMVHILSSTGGAIQTGDYVVESRVSSTVIVLKPDPRLPNFDVAAVSGYVYPNASSTMTGGGSTTAPTASFVADVQAVIIDGVRITASDATARSFTLYKFDGTTVIDDQINVPASVSVGTYIPIGGPGGMGVIGGFAAKSSNTALKGKLEFRIATLAEISGPVRH